MDSVFRSVFGSAPLVRVVDFFLDNQEFGYSMADVIREEGMSFVTLKPIWDEMIRSGMLSEDSKRGKAVLYRLNQQHLIVQQLLRLDEALIQSEIVI